MTVPFPITISTMSTQRQHLLTAHCFAYGWPMSRD